MDDDLFMAGLIVAGVVALLVVIGIPIRQITHHYDVKSCGIFAEESGYQTKFVDYNFFSWDCLARRDDGKWVSRDNLRDMQ